VRGDGCWPVSSCSEPPVTTVPVWLALTPHVRSGSNYGSHRLVRAYAPGMATESSVPPGALAFSRGLYASTLDGYKVADSKGQLLLTLNGVYITVLSSVTIASSQNLVKLHTSLPPATWFLLAGAAVATAISILMAIACLYSRLSDAKLDEIRDPSLSEMHRETFAIGQLRSTGLALSPV
jgi:hypothetical protein